MVDDSGIEALAGRIGRMVRQTRLAQGLSLGDLARTSGLSKTILARIERGAGNPSVETLFRVSHGLRVPLGALLAEDQAPRVRRIRARSGDAIHADAGLTAWLLHAEGREHRSEVFDLDLPVGTDQRSEPQLPATEELVVCTRGVLEVGPVGEEVVLEAGDAVWFAADVPHVYRAVGDEGGARAVNCIFYPATAR